ncbi:helix-turn-helix domain-containing protein [Metabacillus niabensis]|uniref:helix-turn-helix transcriptional regulator n=1 Tax=Metabacillus niabensis TaxID=324854 RepID=UPI0011A1F8FB
MTTPSEKLVLLRKERKLNQSDVAKLLGVATSTIAMMETGQRRGSDEMKKKLAKFYGRSVDEIFFSDKPLISSD